MGAFVDGDGLEFGVGDGVGAEDLGFAGEGDAVAGGIEDSVFLEGVFGGAFADLNAIAGTGFDEVVADDVVFIQAGLLTPAPEVEAEDDFADFIAFHEAFAGIVHLHANAAADDLVSHHFAGGGEVVEINGFVIAVADAAALDGGGGDAVEGDAATEAVLNEAVPDDEVFHGWSGGAFFIGVAAGGEDSAKLGVALHGWVALHTAAIQGEVGDLDGFALADFDEIGSVLVTNDGASGHGERERFFEHEVVCLDLQKLGDDEGAGLFGEAVQFAFCLKMKAHAGLPVAGVSNGYGGDASGCSLGGDGIGQWRQFQDAAFAIHATEGEFFGAFHG